MAGADRHRRRRGGQFSFSLALLLTLVAAVLPLRTMIADGLWVAEAGLVAAIVLGVGAAARWCRVPAWAVVFLEAAGWTMAVTALFLRDVAWFGFVPRPEAFGLVTDSVSTAAFELWMSDPPVAVGAEIAFTLVAAAGLLAIVVDLLAIAGRMPLIAAALLVAVSLVPSLIEPTVFSLAGFVLLAGAAVLLLRAETRTRRLRSRSHRPARGTAGLALALGLIVVLLTGAATPLLPTPTARLGYGTSATTISASLDLGNDLRRPSRSTVLTLDTTAESAPYLRVATLSKFTGSVWRPDSYPTSQIDTDGALPGPQVAPDVETATSTSTVHIDRLRSQYLPVPYSAVSLGGALDHWRIMRDNRTVVSASKHSFSDQEYEVVAETAEPTLEQIESSSARTAPRNERGLPDDVPEVIRAEAERVTAGATSDYDALIALQGWFRGPEFEYSLTAPKAEGFDDSGMNSVAAFLQEKEGYCIHFASAFAIMARELDMPSHIVVGYLPGTLDSVEDDEGRSTYRVSSTQLHAWPEVYFWGIGWVRFDPTKSLGVPTDFGAPPAADNDETAPSDSPSPTSSPSASPSVDATDDPADSAAPPSAAADARRLPWVIGVVIVLLVLLPGLVGLWRRQRLRARARRGEVLAAWQLVRDVATDLAIPVAASDSPRAWGMRLGRDGLAPQRTVAELVRAVEARAYAPTGPSASTEAARSADEVCHSLRRSASLRRRITAVLVPRSLWSALRGARVSNGIRSPGA